ncbi:MAG: 30S ribosomal protein S11 [Candidatus Dojkabacteria bacterium]|nr:30S ribosomal protein S11 [Candidatus Dojkabacteria bacterium]
MAKVNKKVVTAKKAGGKKKTKKSIPPKVLMYVKATYNNTIVSAATYDGSIIATSSCGAIGFKGSRKSTAYASTKTGEDAAMKAIDQGAKEAEVVVKGVGIGRQAAIKGIRQAGLKITLLTDKTPVPHGGCKSRRKPKK